MKNKRPTLQDIADRVGVTKMTVSRCLRDPAKVSAQTAAKIEQAIEELGYIPNKAPDMLSHAKSHAIGILVPSLTNQVFSDVIRGIESITEGAGYQSMLAHYGYSQEVEEQRIASLLAYHVDGLILSESAHSPRTLRMLETAGIPVIEMMDLTQNPIGQCVGFDNQKAAFDMTTAMINKGYQKIVYLGARLDVRTKLKLKGYSKALLAHGLTPQSVMTDAASSFSLGAKLLRQTLEQYPETDGVFCTNDDLAAGVVFECQRQGIEIPNQMAVAGFHGHDVGQAMVPKLASVITPRFEIGEKAATELLARLERQPIKQTQHDLGFKVSLGETV